MDDAMLLEQLLLECNKEGVKEVYPLLVRLRVDDENVEGFKTKLIPTIYKLCDEGYLKKDVIFLCLLINDDSNLLSYFVEYESALPINLSSSTSLFIKTYKEKCYWLEELINNDINIKVFKPYEKSIIIFARLLFVTNSDNIDLSIVQDVLREAKTKYSDDVINVYKEEIKYILKVIKYLQTRVDTGTDLFNFVNKNSLLKIFNTYMPLNESSTWDSLIEHLQYDEQRKNAYQHNSEKIHHFSDFEIFNAFTIIHNVITCLKLSKNKEVKTITSTLYLSETKLCSLSNEYLRIILLEDVFTLCFLKNNNLNINEDDSFFCTQSELFLLLLFIKSCLSKLPSSQDQKCSSKLQSLKRYVTDALWRLETITDVKPNCDNFIACMLAKPEALIKMCLKNNNIDKTVQVIKIFNLWETDLARNVIYTHRLKDLKTSLTTHYKIKSFQKDIPEIASPLDSRSTTKIISSFFTKPEDGDTNEILLENQIFSDLFDLILIWPSDYNNTKELINIAETYYKSANYTKEYIAFKNHAIELFEYLGSEHDQTIQQLLCNPTYNLDMEKYKSNQEFYLSLSKLMETFIQQLHLTTNGNLNTKHDAHATFLKISPLINKDGTRYLIRLFNYLKSLTKLLSVEGNHTDILSRGKMVSYFEILKYSRSELFGKLIFDKNLDPQDLENISNKLKIDCLYHTIFNCFPFIEVAGDNTATPLFFQKPSKMIFSYIQKRNWLLAYIIKEMYDLQDYSMDISENRTKYLNHYVNSNTINHLKILFGSNKIITCLHNNYLQYCIDYLNKNVFLNESDKVDLTDSFETAEEIIEGDYSCNWKYLLNLLESIPEYQLRNNEAVDKTRDRILSNLILDDYESDHYKYVQYIKNESLRADLIFEHFSSWPGDFCIILMNMELARTENSGKSIMEDWLKVIRFCEEVKTMFAYDVWFDVHELCCENQEVIFKQLLLKPKIDLFLNFIELYHPEDKQISTITIDTIKSLLEANENIPGVEYLMLKLPSIQIINICRCLLRSMKNLDHCQFLVNFLKQTNYDDCVYLRNIQTGINIMQFFTGTEKEQLWCLIDRPLHIIEMLIMNTKLDKFGLIVERLKPELEMLENYEDDLSVDNVDELLRQYAEKSLEFRVVVQPHPKLLQGSENKLLQSLDSIYGPDRKHFEMPPNVPTKAEWIPSNEIIECMCCLNTVFSMFNRRHHCRRCGRVVCFNCSSRRMIVPTYGDILVRVCTECYEQSHAESGYSSTISETSNRSIISDYWLLTDNEDHNMMVRQEFSFEYAPSVSLCLSIMKNHSKTFEYAKFLLTQCQNMLCLFKPIAPNGPQEVDYLLVVKMMKSLAIAAKMVCSECHLQAEAAQADRMLSQADMLGLLAERGCLNLLTSSKPNETPYVDAKILRKLRDKLLEREQWNFALDVSTKAGLDNAGVFAAWGKSYLKAGCLQLAREKFQRCLDKTGHYDFADFSLDDSFESSSGRRRYSSRISLSSENKPMKNPPLLNQIIQILENQTTKFDNKFKKEFFSKRIKSTSNLSLNKGVLVNLQTDPAICIKNKLRNLKSIASGNYEHDDSFSNRLDPVFFDECIYYLGKYGTHLSLAQFYIKHDCLHESLHYMISNRVSNDVFIEIYMTCLREGKINIFQEGMATIDSTLELWKDYLKNICRFLEKQGLLHSLYQLQQFMGDFVRAAMTCIRFYKDNVTNYSELLSNIHFLYKAEEHLKQDLAQQEWEQVNPVRRMSTDSRSGYEEKSLANPSLVMKMNSRDVDKHIKTIRRQIEVTDFLAAHEKGDKHLLSILPNIAPSINEDVKDRPTNQVPTLFDSQHEKVQLAVLLIILGDNVTDGYEIVYPIIQEHKLKAIKVYCQAGKQLANENRYEGIAQLVKCIQSKGIKDPNMSHMCDELLASAIRTLSSNSSSNAQLDPLIKLIADRSTKISIYIETKQLKSAYLLAAKYNKYADIRRIMREAEVLNKPEIKKLCLRLLAAHSHSHKDI